ncbi:MAG TPA: VOC family protein [Burkholderiales bacterium]
MQFTVNVDVDVLDRAVDFYCAAFGLSVGRRFGAYAVELVGGSTPIYLLAKEAGTTPYANASAGRSYGRHWTPVHLDFIVDAIEPAIERAVAAGARVEKPVAVYRWGKLALMADPFGHGFCFIEFLGRGYDEIAE